jgi:hypothetical protein
VVLEVTERTLARDPSALLAGIDHQRPEVAGIALDDVGSRTATLSMLPVLSVDVIKLDLAVTQGGTSAAAMKVLGGWCRSGSSGASTAASSSLCSQAAAWAVAGGWPLGMHSVL